MRATSSALFGALAIGLVVGLSADSLAVDMGYVGTQYNMGGNYYPTYSWPQNSIVPWRSSGLAKPLDGDGDNVYGSDGYALFATRFDFPNANAFPGYAYIDPEGDPLYPNLIDLPDWVTEHSVLTDRLAGGYAYALIDDPLLQNGPRWWTFDGVNYPPPDGTNTTGVVPYVKAGVHRRDRHPGQQSPLHADGPLGIHRRAGHADAVPPGRDERRRRQRQLRTFRDLPPTLRHGRDG